MKRRIIYIDNFLTGHGFTPTTGTTLVNLLRQEGYEIITASNRQNKGLRLIDIVMTIILNRRNALVLIATYSTSAFYFACACGFVCRLFNIQYIPCLHGGNLLERIEKSPGKAAKLFGNSYINVAVSGYLKQGMIANRWKCTVIANNINLEDYRYSPKISCRPTLLWVRSFHSIYNPLLAIRIAHALRMKYPETKLTMVGPDKDGSLGESKALVNELGLNEHITFTGLLKREEWTELANSHDIFINTANFDNLPVSVVEAMALGMVVVSTNVGGVPHLISDGKNGLLVPAGNEAAFVEVIENVMQKYQQAQTLSENARSQAEKYDWHTVKLQWIDLLNNIRTGASIIKFDKYRIKQR